MSAKNHWIASSKEGKLEYRSYTFSFKNFIPNDYNGLEPLNDDQLKRRKYHMLPNAMYAYLCKQYCELLPLTLYLDTFIPKNTSIKEEVITMLEYCDHMDIDRLGELGGLYKKYQSLLSPNWIFFVDLFNLRDFQPAPPPDKIAEAVEEWVSEHPKHELKGCNFYALHRYGVKIFLNSITKIGRAHV